MTGLDDLLQKNRQWAKKVAAQDPEFFPRLAQQQTPKILWIGCSDSRVPPSRILDLPPGEVFVHRNIANVVAPDDLSCTSVLQYAVEALRVRHIIVCGHTGCGGVAAALEGNPLGEMDSWLHHIKEVHRAHRDAVAATPAAEQLNLMCALNTRAQLRNVAESPIVQRAWQKGDDLTLHAWLYHLQDGVIKPLETVEKPAAT